MSRIEGRFFDGLSSHPRRAAIDDSEPPQLSIEDVETRPLDLRQARTSERLGRLPRQIHFADGAHFETDDNDAIDALLKRWHSDRAGGFLHRLESRWRYTLAGLVAIAGIGWLFFTLGVPWLSDAIARQLPDRLYTSVSEQTLTILRQHLLLDSSIDPPRQAQIQTEFERLVADLESASGFTLLFGRVRGRSMANAFALPDGRILVTDELIELAQNPDQVIAVLAHETGHVVQRHGMRRLVQDSILVFAGLMVSGDTTGLSASALGLPTLLLELGYSRQFEFEADAFATDLLRRQGYPPAALAQILERLENQAGGRSEPASGAGGVPDYLSTHPATGARVQRILRPAGTDPY